MSSAASIPDSPIGGVEADLLARAPFARGLAHLIADAPKGTSLRIGVFGGWGEGKTSVLQMMRRELADRGHPCVWITPWLTDDPGDFAEYLTREIATALGIDLKWFSSRRSVKKFLDSAKVVADIDPRLKAANALFAAAVARAIGKRADRQGEALARSIDEALGDRKLVVFVDDVDRVRPDLVPRLLLTLREGLDRPNLFYVMALDPRVVEAGLAMLHQGWGAPATFLEKVIELPRTLPEPTAKAISSYLHALMSATGLPTEQDLLEGLAPALPTNPRRLKLILRYFATLRRLVVRFSEDELDRRTFFLVQTLRTEFPAECQRLLADDKAVQEIEYGGVIDRVERDAGGRREAKARVIDAIAPTDATRRSRFVGLCDLLMQGSAGSWSPYDLPTQANLPEAEPAFTLKEVSDLVDAWEKAPTRERPGLVEAALGAGADADPSRPRALWNTLMRVRDLHLGGVAELDLQEALEAGLGTASAMTEVAHHLAFEPPRFRDGVFGLDEWTSLFRVVAQWAHFRSLPYYDRIRAEERALLGEVFHDLPTGVKARMHASLRYRYTEQRRDLGTDFNALLTNVADAAEDAAVKSALELFRRPDGVAALWSEKSPATSEKAVLFSPDSKLYRDAAWRAEFLETGAEAASNPTVHLNFLTFFRQLAYGALHGGSFSMQDCQALLSDADLVRAVWTAALARPVNPRVAGSLRGDRAGIAPRFTPEDALPVPPWWKALEDAGFFKS